jgi:hypothetical protein
MSNTIGFLFYVHIYNIKIILFLTLGETAGMYNMSVVDVIKHYQRSIERCPENKERVSVRSWAF